MQLLNYKCCQVIITIQEELNSLVQAPSGSVPAPTVGDSKKIASPKESLLLLDGISKEVSSEMEFREKNVV